MPQSLQSIDGSPFTGRRPKRLRLMQWGVGSSGGGDQQPGKTGTHKDASCCWEFPVDDYRMHRL